MRKLIEQDIAAIAGTVLQEYYVESVRIKRGQFTDSDHYGIVLGRNVKGHYVTWEFHIDENEKPVVYWGHYFMENREAALKDFDTRDLDSSPSEYEDSIDRYKVTITETLKLSVEVEAKNQQEAEQIVSDKWRNSEYILDADNFVDVEFEAVQVTQDD